MSTCHPTAPRRTASDCFAFLNVSSGSGTPTSSKAAPPMGSSSNLKSSPDTCIDDAKRHQSLNLPWIQFEGQAILASWEREKEPSSDPARRRASTATGMTSLPTPSPGSTAMVYRLFGGLAAHLITEALLKVCLVAEINAIGSCVVMTCNPRAPAI